MLESWRPGLHVSLEGSEDLFRPATCPSLSLSYISMRIKYHFFVLDGKFFNRWNSPQEVLNGKSYWAVEDDREIFFICQDNDWILHSNIVRGRMCLKSRVTACELMIKLSYNTIDVLVSFTHSLTQHSINILR